MQGGLIKEVDGIDGILFVEDILCNKPGIGLFGKVGTG
jgi:hypothetical protein